MESDRKWQAQLYIVPPSPFMAPPRPPCRVSSRTAAFPSAGALRLPVLATGLSMTLVGTCGVARSGSSSGSLPGREVSIAFARGVDGLRW